MLFTLTTTHSPATDLGYLLHKNPARHQTFDLSFGKAHVFYPEADGNRCTAALLLDVDPVALVRNRRGPAGEGFSLQQYVNDRPYAASSFLSVAIVQVFSSALSGTSRERPELVGKPIPLTARLSVVPCRGGETLLRRLFEPLGYAVAAIQHPLDEQFPEWGEGSYFTVELTHTIPLRELLTHLYVLVPVLDNDKHYWIGEDEVEKLLRHGDPWLAGHPEQEQIVRRYLKHRRHLADSALAQLTDADPDEAETAEQCKEQEEEQVEQKISLNEHRLNTVLSVLRAAGAKRVLDLGCNTGNLLRRLLEEKQFEQIVGMDVAHRALEIAAERLHLDRLPERQRQRIQLLHGSLTYRDQRLAGFDAAAVVEVIEHLDEPRLSAFERVLFEFARPVKVIVTTPNVEYNVRFETLPAGQFRHKDHRFEWTRQQFRDWSMAVAARHGYAVRFLPVGPEDGEVGPATQMAVFEGHAGSVAQSIMKLIVFMGLQGSGKSTFYKRQFADTHVRINLDMLKTRRRERLLFDACLAAKLPMVIDNTNPTPDDRARYIVPARAAGFSVVGYYFQSRVEDCKKRNAQRSPDRVVPLGGLLGTYNRLVQPTRQEGFDQLFYVRIDGDNQFVLEEWSDEV